VYQGRLFILHHLPYRVRQFPFDLITVRLLLTNTSTQQSIIQSP
jgi:hypothetical protein